MKKIAIWNENTIGKGLECHAVDIDEQGRAIGPNGMEFGDVTVYDVTQTDVDRLTAMGGFYGIVAATIEAYL